MLSAAIGVVVTALVGDITFLLGIGILLAWLLSGNIY